MVLVTSGFGPMALEIATKQPGSDTGYPGIRRSTKRSRPAVCLAVSTEIATTKTTDARRSMFNAKQETAQYDPKYRWAGVDALQMIKRLESTTC